MRVISYPPPRVAFPRWNDKRKLLDEEEGSSGHVNGEDEMDEGTFYASRYTENT